MSVYYAWDRAAAYQASATTVIPVETILAIEDCRFKAMQYGNVNSISKGISSKFGYETGWFRSGFPPTTAPNTGFFFCPEFKFTVATNGTSDANTWLLMVTYTVETKGQRFMK